MGLQLSPKIGRHLGWSLSDLSPRVPDDTEPHLAKDQLTLAVPTHLRPALMGGGSIEFGDEPLLSPHRIDLHTGDLRVDLG